MGKKDVSKLVAAIRKQQGENSVVRLGDRESLPIDVISSGIPSLDSALGIGGFPRGRVVEIFGPECVDEDTFVSYNIRTKTGRRQNAKGGTVGRLYNRFHKISEQGQGCYQRKSTLDSEFFSASINELGRVIQNKIVDVVFGGDKPCLEIITSSGRRIVATADHKFLVWTVPSPVTGEYRKAVDLAIGDLVFVHNNTPHRGREKPVDRPDIFVKHHPVAGIKRIGKYTYKRINKARALMEAKLNKLSLTKYVEKLNSGSLSGLVFLPRGVHVHHRDGDPTNNRNINLQILNGREHNRQHAIKGHNNLRFTAVSESIKSIVSVGVRRTYDIRMTAPHNNYIANGFVVHNSGGKTTLALQAVAEAQKLDGTAVFIDAEHAFDEQYAAKLGVDTDNLIISQPDDGEQALEVAEALVRSEEVDIVVVDSVAALVPRAEIQGQMGDAQMGLQARLMSQAMRKLTGAISRTNTCLIFINQLRSKIGVMFGNPETTTGGNALKFYASIRLDIRRTQTLKNGDEAVGTTVKIKVAKNKCAAPYKIVEVDLLFGQGFDRFGDILSLGVQSGIIEKSGAWFSYKGERLGMGKENVRNFLKENSDLCYTILNEIKNKNSEAEV